MPRIVVNGKSYSSVDEMPPDIRQAYEQAMGVLADRDGNGVPDILEGEKHMGVSQTPLSISSTQFVVDGKAYSSVDELPYDAREKVEQAMAEMDQMTGDAKWGHDRRARPEVSMPPPLAGESSDEVAHYRGMLLLAGVVIVALLAALFALGAFVVLPLLK